MVLIQKASKLGYKHYTEFTIDELDKLQLNNPNKQIEYYFIRKWLREVHKNLVIILPLDNWNSWIITIYSEDIMSPFYKSFEAIKDNCSYEESLEIGLYQALLLLQ